MGRTSVRILPARWLQRDLIMTNFAGTFTTHKPRVARASQPCPADARKRDQPHVQGQAPNVRATPHAQAHAREQPAPPSRPHVQGQAPNVRARRHHRQPARAAPPSQTPSRTFRARPQTCGQRPAPSSQQRGSPPRQHRRCQPTHVNPQAKPHVQGLALNVRATPPPSPVAWTARHAKTNAARRTKRTHRAPATGSPESSIGNSSTGKPIRRSDRRHPQSELTPAPSRALRPAAHNAYACAYAASIFPRRSSRGRRPTPSAQR